MEQIRRLSNINPWTRIRWVWNWSSLVISFYCKSCRANSMDCKGYKWGPMIVYDGGCGGITVTGSSIYSYTYCACSLRMSRVVTFTIVVMTYTIHDGFQISVTHVRSSVDICSVSVTFVHIAHARASYMAPSAITSPNLLRHAFKGRTKLPYVLG